MALTPGTRLGPYDILTPLGAGGMGEVYKARDTRLARTVAIKVLPADTAADVSARARFEREARAIAALSHPHICVVHDVGHQDGIDYLVMELLEGETLFDRLAKAKGPLPLDQVLTIGVAIADALDKAHRAGIVHRDLKPANVMLTRSGPKLLDFGLAKLQGTASPVSLSNETAATTAGPGTARGTILGTIHYMAPEQVEGREADTRTDIWALGALLYEMATGQRPFTGESAASIIGAILNHTPPALSTRQPLTPTSFERLVNKCLMKDADERWQSAKDLHDELAWIGEGAVSNGVTPPSSASSRRERVAWGLVAAAALISAGLVATLVTRRADATAPQPLTMLDVATPPTFEPLSFALSPDGRQLAFVANGNDGSQLWVRRMDEPVARPLAGTAHAISPFWSPDGHAVAFFADGLLKRLDLPGGTPLVLAPGFGRGGAWNRDGVILFTQSSNAPLVQVSAQGGTVSPATQFATDQISHRWPHFLPDGRRFLFEVANGPLAARGIYLGSLDGAAPSQLSPTEAEAIFAPPGHLLMATQGSLFVQPFDVERGALTGTAVAIADNIAIDASMRRGGVTVSDAGVLAYRAGVALHRQVVWTDRAGTVVKTLIPLDDSALAYPELSPDDRRVSFYRNQSGDGNIWVGDSETGRLTPFTFGTANTATAVWSPKGDRVVYRSSRRGRWDLFIKPFNGDEQTLLATDQDKVPQDWTADGRYLVFAVQASTGHSDLWMLPMSGQGAPVPLVQSDADEVQAQVSPDGRWLAYASNETGRYEVYVRSFPGGGAKQQISVGGGLFPRWARSGRELFYVTETARMMAVPVEARAGGLAAGAPVSLFESRLTLGANSGIGGVSSRAPYAVAADGRFLLAVIADDAARSPITVVQNWQMALRK